MSFAFLDEEFISNMWFVRRDLDEKTSVIVVMEPRYFPQFTEAERNRLDFKRVEGTEHEFHFNAISAGLKLF